MHLALYLPNINNWKVESPFQQKYVDIIDHVRKTDAWGHDATCQQSWNTREINNDIIDDLSCNQPDQISGAFAAIHWGLLFVESIVKSSFA